MRALCLMLLLGGCGSLSRISEIGRPPEMTPSGDPTRDPAFAPLSLPAPKPDTAPITANALWRTGSRAFFRDQRAGAVGDLVTVLVNIGDAADLSDTTNATRNAATSAGIPNLFGLESRLPKAISGATPASLIATGSTVNNVGTGQTKRAETVTLKLAGVVTQVLAGGNLVVVARQEVRVNHELRELLVTGIIRPEDIASDNTITHDRIAEARISYGGRGQLTDVQTPRYGQQLLDVLLPF